MKRAARMAKALDVDHWDLGSIPRSTQSSMIFFLTYSHAALSNDAHHTSPNPRRQVSSHSKPVAKDERLWYSLVNEHAPDPESQSRLETNGPRICLQTSSLGPSPPWFLWFFPFYFLFLLISFINYYYYYLINSHNYFS